MGIVLQLSLGFLKSHPLPFTAFSNRQAQYFACGFNVIPVVVNWDSIRYPVVKTKTVPLWLVRGCILYSSSFLIASLSCLNASTTVFTFPSLFWLKSFVHFEDSISHIKKYGRAIASCIFDFYCLAYQEASSQLAVRSKQAANTFFGRPGDSLVPYAP
jgi:hypothetical protein